MVGVPILYKLDNVIFGQRPLPVARNDFIQAQTVHHALTVITDPAMSGMSDPLVNVAHRLILHKLPRI